MSVPRWRWDHSSPGHDDLFELGSEFGGGEAGLWLHHKQLGDDALRVLGDADLVVKCVLRPLDLGEQLVRDGVVEGKLGETVPLKLFKAFKVIIAEKDEFFISVK